MKINKYSTPPQFTLHASSGRLDLIFARIVRYSSKCRKIEDGKQLIRSYKMPKVNASKVLLWLHGEAA